MHALAHRPAVVKSEASAAPANSGGAMLAAGSPSRTSGPRIAQGNTGVVFYKCKTCMIVSTHNDTIQPGNCKTAVSKLGDYLVENGV